ncbi:MAG: hypothetical protein EAZ14_08890 [Runella slithyformis]|nr:MAG: hypothetical protein EAZ38_07280 [Cytophagales bacterium]TAG40893.1 MAG: hypothetical protein EAZ32_04860 [Cytophagia bacterium]TAG82572.1 MAG: hypothetical protein EAZ22_05080 [Cytophagales bacterium]TAH09609.1 MAG: hypothetical protein EAZ14_08890 [Runella slithyformis]
MAPKQHKIMNKNTILSTTLLAAVILAHSGSAVAKSHLDVKVKLVKTQGKKLRVLTTENTQKNVEVTIENEAGEVLYNGRVSGVENASREFNLTALPDGNYTMNFSNASFFSTQRVQIQNGNLVIEAGSYQEIVKPQLKAYGQNRVEVMSDIANMSVIINDNNNEEVYRSSIAQGRHFDLNLLGSGRYTFSFIVEGKQFTETINVFK